jgi:serine/threonine protein kinase
LEALGLDLSGFEERSVIDRVSSQIYLQRIDGALTVVKAISLSELIKRCQIEKTIDNLLNLRDPVITTLIGCVFLVESIRCEFKTVRLYATEGSLEAILSNPHAWWTPTAIRKVVVGFALGLRFAHGFGLLHGAVNASNILLVLICGFESRISMRSGWKRAKLSRFLGKGERRRQAFARLRPYCLRSRLVTKPLRPSMFQD